MEGSIAVLLLALAAYALVATRLDRLSISPAMAFVAAGLLLSAEPLAPVSFSSISAAVQLVAQVTLTLLLFADASALRLSELRRDVAPLVRLLGIGLPLTIA